MPYFCKKALLKRMRRDRCSNSRKDEVIGRYENFKKGGKLGYFEVDELETIVNHYMEGAQPEEAMDALRYGQRLHPNSSTLLTKQARLYAETGDTQKALSLLKYVQTIDSGDEDANLLKGEILLRRGETEEALAIFRNIAKEEDNDVSTLLNIAYALNDNRMIDEGLAYLTQANAIEKNNIDVLYEICYCLEQKGRYDEAIVTYNTILDINPYANEAWFNLGNLHLYHEDYEQAIEAFDYAYTVTPNDYQSLFQKATACFQCGRFIEAAEAFDEHMDLTGETADNCILLGECYEKLGEIPTARTYYSKAWRLDENNVDALTGLCICAIELNNSEEALLYIDKAIQIKGESAEFWIYKAEAYLADTKNDNDTVLDEEQKALSRETKRKAIACYEKALKFDPQQLDSLISVGTLHADLEEYNIALNYFEKAKKVQDNAEGLALLLAITFYKLKEYVMCQKYVKESVAEDPSSLQSFIEICPEVLDDPNINIFSNL